jgi:hypothetical protein
MDSVENNKKRTYIHKKLKYKLNIYDNDIDKNLVKTSDYHTLNEISKELNLSSDTCYRIKNNYYNQLKKCNHKRVQNLKKIEIVRI